MENVNAYIEQNLSKKNFDSIIQRTELQISSQNNEINELVIADDAFQEYIQGTSLLEDLSGHFMRADLIGKKKLIGSIFPENLVFERKKYRTPVLNSVITLIHSKDKEFRRIKKEMPDKNIRQSGKVAPTGIEPVSKV